MDAYILQTQKNSENKTLLQELNNLSKSSNVQHLKNKSVWAAAKVCSAGPKEIAKKLLDLPQFSPFPTLLHIHITTQMKPFTECAKSAWNWTKSRLWNIAHFTVNSNFCNYAMSQFLPYMYVPIVATLWLLSISLVKLYGEGFQE